MTTNSTVCRSVWHPGQHEGIHLRAQQACAHTGTEQGPRNIKKC